MRVLWFVNAALSKYLRAGGKYCNFNIILLKPSDCYPTITKPKKHLETNNLLSNIFLFSCSKTEKNNTKSNNQDPLGSKKEAFTKTTYIHLNKLSIIGDFDGDGKVDTLIN